MDEYFTMARIESLFNTDKIARDTFLSNLIDTEHGDRYDYFENFIDMSKKNHNYVIEKMVYELAKPTLCKKWEIGYHDSFRYLCCVKYCPKKSKGPKLSKVKVEQSKDLNNENHNKDTNGKNLNHTKDGNNQKIIPSDILKDDKLPVSENPNKSTKKEKEPCRKIELMEAALNNLYIDFDLSHLINTIDEFNGLKNIFFLSYRRHLLDLLTDKRILKIDGKKKEKKVEHNSQRKSQTNNILKLRDYIGKVAEIEILKEKDLKVFKISGIKEENVEEFEKVIEKHHAKIKSEKLAEQKLIKK